MKEQCLKEQCPSGYGKLPNPRGRGIGCCRVTVSLLHTLVCAENRLGKSGQCYLLFFLDVLHFTSLQVTPELVLFDRWK